MDKKDLQKRFSKLYRGSKENLDQSESKLKSRFHKSEILEDLGYNEQDIKVEKSDERGKRTDIHCTDEYGNVSFVVEFKKPNVDVGKSKHKEQLVDRYMKPLKADFGILYNGLKVVAYRREGLNSEHLFTKRADDLGDKAKEIIKFAEKPDYSLTKIDNVREYFEKFDEQEEKLELVEESAREHFFENFKLEKNSSFENLLISTIDLFQQMKGENQFLDSAFRFWKESYAKKPEEVPSSWENIMERTDLSGKSDLYEFMFCLETSYAIFARLIMAKSGEDYDFSDANFSKFIETEVDRASRRGDIAGASWAKVTQELITDMRDNLVSSVFEEDIFYWWTEHFEDKSYNDLFHVKQIPNETIKFGTSLGKITLMIYKFNFSKIDGDPLGVLYQQYFDKETRKALGEFYTPQEVVDYILDSVDYNGRQVLDKRLLDPACGSGTFPVSALQRYLNAAESSGRAEEEGWDQILDELCNQYRIVGFDIHPFATIMAQIQFMLVLMPYYKKAIEDAKERGEHFKIQRIPIFRTDSLKDESKGENPTLDQFEGGEKFKMDVKLPVNKEEGGDFFDEEFAMPTPQAARKVGLHNNQEYFGALQAFFDVIKEQASEMEDQDQVPEFDRQRFETHLRKYSLTDKDWNQISTLFQSFADQLLHQINRLQTEFDDGRLIKSIEDIYLAALLKNEQKYDYVVGNPPYVNIKNIPEERQEEYKSNYETAYGRFDLYVLFVERGMDWLDEGRLGYITSNKFTRSKYGEPLRKLIADTESLEKYIEFGDVDVFDDATNFASIFVINPKLEKKYIEYAKVYEGSENVLERIEEKLGDEISSDGLEISKYPVKELSDSNWRFTTEKVRNLSEKVENKFSDTISDISHGVREGVAPGEDDVFIVDKETIEEKDLEKDIIISMAKGKQVRKWKVKGEEHNLIYPYKEDGDLVNFDNYPKIKEYLERNREKLEDRYCVRKAGKSIFEFHGPHPKSVYEGEIRLPTPDMSTQNNFSHPRGFESFKNTAYVLTFPESIDYDSNELLGILNSNIAEFIVKQESPPLRGRPFRYRYKSQYVGEIPVPDETDEIGKLVKDILQRESLDEKVDRFPSTYIGDSELSRKTLKCNSGHPDM
ncbi:MAG: Eco57I restriction-modification methylase domain-containing protein, partial [Candidatus Nanohaloarchaea archaeon]